jgi:membrane-associated two-gene conflict system component 1 (EACC1)
MARMTEPDTRRALLRLEAADEADAEELDRLARRLRAELGELDVDVRAVAGDLPAGAKAADPVTIGSLVVAFSAAGGVFPGLLETLREWLGRQTGKHRIKVTVDGDTVELERATSAERQQLIDAFVRRHA